MCDGERGHRGAEAVKDLIFDGFQISHEDMLMLEGYIRGTISGVDMLTYAHQFTTADAYRDWLIAHRKTESDVLTSNVSVEEVLREFQNYIKRKSCSVDWNTLNKDKA